MKKNDAMRNSLCDSFADLFDGGSVAIYTGAQPADPDSAVTGTLLATITIPTPAFAAASANTVAKTGTWSAIAIATGVAGYARVMNAAGTKWVDVDIAESATEMIIDDENVTTGGAVVISTFVYGIPE